MSFTTAGPLRYPLGEGRIAFNHRFLKKAVFRGPLLTIDYRLSTIDSPSSPNAYWEPLKTQVQKTEWHGMVTHPSFPQRGKVAFAVSRKANDG